MQADYPHKPFDEPVELRIGGRSLSINSVDEAYRLLLGKEWPAGHDPRYRDLCDLCLKVFDGHRSTAEARKSLAALAKEHGLLRED